MTAIRIMAGATVALVLAVACSTAPTGTQSPGATTPPPPGATTPPPVGATATPATTPPPGGGTGNECAAFPSFDPLSTAEPVLLRDPELEAKFPAVIDGQPVTGLESFNWAQSLCFGGQTVFDRLKASLPVNVDLTKLTVATADAVVNGESVELAAFRLGGGDANLIVQALVQLDAAAGGDSDIASVGAGTAAGRPAVVITNDDGTLGYGIVSGDTFFAAEGIDQAQADKIFAAFP